MVTQVQDEGGVASEEGGVAPDEWEALKLQLSRDDIARGTDIESYIIKDLIVRHQKYISAQSSE